MHHKKRQLFFVKLHPCSFYNACPRASVYGSVVPEPCGINGHQELLSHSHGGCFHLARAVCKQMSDLWNSHRGPFVCYVFLAYTIFHKIHSNNDAEIG